MDELGYGKEHIIGYSFGAWAALGQRAAVAVLTS